MLRLEPVNEPMRNMSLQAADTMEAAMPLPGMTGWNRLPEAKATVRAGISGIMI